MKLDEEGLKKALKNEPAGAYLLYGAESYLTGQYAHILARHAVEDEDDVFNCQWLDGQTVTAEQVEAAAMAMPMMADRKCVLVRDMDAGAAENSTLPALVENLPDTCVLVFWQITAAPDKRKGWTALQKAVEQHGTVVCFDRGTAGDVARRLVNGAKRRGCTLTMDNAYKLVEQAGNDLHLLTGELDKLSALADGGEITREMIDTAGTKNLESRVFDLSKAILQKQTARAMTILDQLFAQREEPVAILGAMSTAYADLYRAKAASAAGMSADQMAAAFAGYKGKEFRLRNAMRDASRLSVTALREALDILAETDTALKMSGGDGRVRLEQTVCRLIEVK